MLLTLGALLSVLLTLGALLSVLLTLGALLSVLLTLGALPSVLMTLKALLTVILKDNGWKLMHEVRSSASSTTDICSNKLDWLQCSNLQSTFSRNLTTPCTLYYLELKPFLPCQMGG